ncbi:unnamed protein product, partial [Polarella glacialis]
MPVASDEIREWVPAEASHMANDVYSLNHELPYKPLLPRDIRLVKQNEMECSDLWLLSPPCQPYTRLGRQQDVGDKRASPLLHLTEMLPKLRQKPKALLVENVVGFETSESWHRLADALLE